MWRRSLRPTSAFSVFSASSRTAVSRIVTESDGFNENSHRIVLHRKRGLRTHLTERRQTKMIPILTEREMVPGSMPCFDPICAIPWIRQTALHIGASWLLSSREARFKCWLRGEMRWNCRTAVRPLCRFFIARILGVFSMSI